MMCPMDLRRRPGQCWLVPRAFTGSAYSATRPTRAPRFASRRQKRSLTRHVSWLAACMHLASAARTNQMNDRMSWTVAHFRVVSKIRL
jgi:hypothetical protein